MTKTPPPADTARFNLHAHVANLTDEGAAALRRNVRAWADRRDFAVTWEVKWDGEDGPAARVTVEADFPRAMLGVWVSRHEKPFDRMVARVRRLHRLHT